MAFGITAGTWLMAGAAVGGGLIAANGAKSAAKSSAQAAKDANDVQLQMYNQTRDDQAPYRQAGYTALGQLGSGTSAGGDYNRAFTMNDYVQDPGYQFRLDEGNKAINNAAAAGGSRYSGATLKALTKYGSDQASQEFNNAYNRWTSDTTNRFNRLASVAGIGQTAANQTAAAGSAAASGIAAGTMAAGNATASGYVGTANAVNGTLGSLVNNYQQQQMLSTLRNSSGYGNNANYPTGGYDPSSGAVDNTLW
jgi:hypothetical protein